MAGTLMHEAYIPWKTRRHQAIIWNSSSGPMNRMYEYLPTSETHKFNPNSEYSAWTNQSPYNPNEDYFNGPFREPVKTQYIHTSYVPSSDWGDMNLEIGCKSRYTDANGSYYIGQYRHSYDANEANGFGLSVGDVRTKIPSGESKQYMEIKNSDLFTSEWTVEYGPIEKVTVMARIPFTAWSRRYYLNESHNPQTGVRVTMNIEWAMSSRIQKFNKFMVGQNVVAEEEPNTIEPTTNKKQTVEYEFQDSDNPALPDYTEKLIWSDWFEIASITRIGRFNYTKRKFGPYTVSVNSWTYETSIYEYADTAFGLSSKNVFLGFNNYSEIWVKDMTNPKGFWQI